MARKKKIKLPKIIACDFDGVLHDGKKYPFIGNPVDEVIAWIKNERQGGAKIILWTCREGTQLRYALEWCSEHDIEFDAVNCNIDEVLEKYGSGSRKVYADIYLDDKNILLSMITEDK